MELFDYLMTKKGHNLSTRGDLFSYLLGKNAGGSGTYTTFSGTSLNISNTLKAKIKNFMLNSTELTQDETPTPDTPQDIHVITGSNNVKIQNKNLALNDDPNNPDANYKSAGAGSAAIQYDTTEEGFYTTTSRMRNFKLEEGKTYVFSFDGKYRATGSVRYIYYYYFNSITEEVTAVQGSIIVQSDSYTRYSKKFTIPSGYDGFRIIVFNGIYFKDIQLEEGSTATEYVEHQEQNYPISLGELEYCKIGDYADQFFKNTTDSEEYNSELLENEWYLKKNIGKVVLNGSETFYYVSAYKYFTISTPNGTPWGNPISNYFTNDTTTRLYITGGNTANLKWLFDLDDYFNEDVETFKTWLSTHNTKVYYSLATPQYIHISETDYTLLRNQLENIWNNSKSYNGQTNITQKNEDLPFNISVDVKVSSANLGMSNSLNTSLLNENTTETQNIVQSEEQTNLDDTNEKEESIEEYQEL